MARQRRAQLRPRRGKQRRRREEAESAAKTTNAPTAKTALAGDGAGTGDGAGIGDGAGTKTDASTKDGAAENCANRLRERKTARAQATSSAHVHTSGAVSECTLVAITSSRAGSARYVNKLSRAGRAQFNALGDAMRAVLGICSRARDAIVRKRVRSLNCVLNRCTCAILHSDEMARDANAARECGVAVRSSPKFF